MAEAKQSGMVKIMRYFGIENVAKFRAEWSKLTESDREQLRAGIENGSLTY